MPSPSTDSETTAIEDAYKAEIQELFKILVKNLIGARNSHETDQQCLSRFTAGLNVTPFRRDTSRADSSIRA